MKKIPFLFLTLGFFGCSTMDSANPNAGASWYSTMHRLSANHASLMPYVSNQREFYDPKNLPVLREKTNDMMKAAKALTQDPEAPNADPMISFTAKEFAKDMTFIAEAVDSGKLQSAHYAISNVGNYCINCHSRADRGSKNFPLPWATDLSHLNTSQKTLFLLSNRQYESAHLEAEKMLKDKNLLAQDPNTWMSTLQKDLAVVIRVQEDLPRAQKIITQALNNKDLPQYMKKDIQAWKRSLKEWQSEKLPSKTGSKNLMFVKKLIDQAQSPAYEQGQAGFIIYLRASAILHELLETSRKSPNYSSILYYAGLNADALKNVDVWQLGEHYFEVCIDNSPYTKISLDCYKQLERLVLQSHPNMNQMPELEKQVLQRLANYKDLARPKNPVKEMIRTNESGPRY